MIKKKTIKVVPIKVKVGITLNGQPKFPDWQLLSMAEKKSPREEMFFQWMFDKIGYKENTPDSPYGIQWAIRLVSKKLAKQAAEIFPKEITILTEKQLEEFWETKITAHFSDQVHDHEELIALNARFSIIKQLGNDEIEIRERIKKALDPDDPAVGVCRHPFKKWQDFKKKNYIQIISM